MSVGFFVVSVNTNGQTIDVIEENISMYEINACLCQSSYACDDALVAVEQGTSIGICLTSSSSVVKITNIALSMSANGYTYDPVTMNGSDQIMDSTTFVTTDGPVTKITARLVTGLFQGLSNVVVISGNGVLEFEENRKRSPDTASKEYEVFVSTYSLPVNQNIMTLFFSFLRTLVSILFP